MQRFASLNVCESKTYISWSIDFVLYLADYLMDECLVLEILIQCDTTLTLNDICRSVSYISWSSDFALYLESYLMDKCHNWNIGSV